jgi:hypothetical protein
MRKERLRLSIANREEDETVTVDPTLTVVALIAFVFLIRTLSGG